MFEGHIYKCKKCDTRTNDYSEDRRDNEKTRIRFCHTCKDFTTQSRQAMTPIVPIPINNFIQAWQDSLVPKGE